MLTAAHFILSGEFVAQFEPSFLFWLSFVIPSPLDAH